MEVQRSIFFLANMHAHALATIFTLLLCESELAMFNSVVDVHWLVHYMGTVTCFEQVFRIVRVYSCVP